MEDKLKYLLMHPDKLLENLFVCLRNKYINAEFLKDTIHEDKLDLSLVVYIRIAEQNNNTYQVKLCKEILEFGILKGMTEKDIFKKAFANTIKNYPSYVVPVLRVLPLIGKIPPPPRSETFQLAYNDMTYVGTTMYTGGAIAMFYPNLLRRIGDKIGCFYIIPSSIHEVLIQRADGLSVKDIKDTIKSTNRDDEYVTGQEVLSDSLYYYNAILHQLNVVDNQNYVYTITI